MKFRDTTLEQKKKKNASATESIYIPRLVPLHTHISPRETFCPWGSSSRVRGKLTILSTAHCVCVGRFYCFPPPSLSLYIYEYMTRRTRETDISEDDDDEAKGFLPSSLLELTLLRSLPLSLSAGLIHTHTLLLS